MREVVLRHPNELAQAALAAAARIRPFVLATPLQHAPLLAAFAPPGCSVHLKMESEQLTNSFKVRGAVNKVLSLTPEQLRGGLVTCSTGNHALAFVEACRACLSQQQQQQQQPSPQQQQQQEGGGAQQVLPPPEEAPRSLVFLPTTASSAKLSRLRALGAEVVQFGADCVLAEAEARRVAAEQGSVYISPYNDANVMAGQGSVAVEVLQQLQVEGLGAPDVVIVPVGGGGLIGGIAAVLKAADPAIQVIGAQPAASDVMRQSVAAGHIVDAPPLEEETLSDATAGGIEDGAVTLQPCIDCVDRWVTVSEQEIADALVTLLQLQGKVVEGAAGCALAAFRRLAADGELKGGKRVVIVLCGGNIAPGTLQHVLAVGRAWGA